MEISKPKEGKKNEREGTGGTGEKSELLVLYLLTINVDAMFVLWFTNKRARHESQML